ncbi:MAG: imidazoleglycerol-phosphate dehydratase HisB [Pseudomonadota bacterium]
MRKASLSRETRETKITAEINLDGTGDADIKTGIGFLDHMLDSFSRHSLIDITLAAVGDLEVDFHHTTEDTGIVLGKAVRQAMGEAKGIRRFANVEVPMDEACTRVAIDISGRPMLVWNVAFSRPKIGEMDTELFQEWFQAFAGNAGLTLHVQTLYGENAHHVAESCFKATARALRAALEHDPRVGDRVPSTKGTIEV